MFEYAASDGALSPGLLAWANYTISFACYDTNLDRARELLAEAGYPNGFETSILTFGTIQVVSDVAQVVQAQLRQVGIDVDVNIAEFGAFVQGWRNSDFDMFVSLNGGSSDPDGYLHRTFVTGGSTNVFLFSDPAVDELLNLGRTTSDMAERVNIYDHLQKRLACTGPISHIAYGTLFSAVSDDVEGFQQLPTRSLRYLREVTLR